MMRILAISPGWKEKGPSWIHSLEPEISLPMSIGSSSSATPAMPMVNLYCARSSRLGTRTSVATMAATERKSHMTWPVARSGARRVTKVMPTPDSKKTSGRIAGSAPGASLRIARWATVKAPKSPMGTDSEENESATCMLVRYIA